MRFLLRRLAYRIPGFLDWRLRQTLRLTPWRFSADGRIYEMMEPEEWVHQLDNDDGLGRVTGLDRNKRFEAAFCDKFISKLDESTVLLDVGAAHGLYSLIAARTCYPENIHCFEPDPVARWILDINNKRYCAGRLHVDPHPVGSHAEGDTVTLDQYCEQHRIRPTLVKLDIEGGEIQALAGMRRICTEDKPTILMEFHLRKLRQQWKADPEDVLKILRSYGYGMKFNGHHWHLVLRAGQPDLSWSHVLPNDVNCALLAEPLS